MRVGCICCLFSSQPVSQSIFFISIFLSYEGSLMFHAFRYPWRMPRGSPCHVKVLNFTVALMPFLSGLSSALGGRDYKDMQTQNYWPRTPFKVYETLSVPLGQLTPWPHCISGSFHWKKARAFSCFLLFSQLWSLAFKSDSVGNVCVMELCACLKNISSTY